MNPSRKPPSTKNKVPRICFCPWQLFNLLAGGTTGYGGAEVVIWNLARGLASSGAFDIRVLTLSIAPQARVLRENLIVEYVPAGAAIPATLSPVSRYMRILRNAVTVVKNVVHQRADVYVAVLPSVESVLVYVAARLRRATYIYRIAHDWETNEKELSDNILGGRRWLARALGYCIANADGVVAQTEEQRRRLKENYGVDARVIHNPHVIQDPVPEKERPPTVLWIARVHPMKRPMEFLELARSLSSAKFRMILAPAVGQEGLFEEILSLASGLRNLELIPGIPSDETCAAFESVRVTILTSEAEGLSNVLIESLKAATPVISFHHNPDGILAPVSSGELLPAGGYCVAGERTKAVEIIRRLVSDSSFWSDCSRRAFELAKENFDAEQIIPMYQELLMTVMRRRS